MSHILDPHVPTVEAIAQLLKPHAEVVLHDLATGTIFHIAGSLSFRRPGDPSLTEIEGVASIDRPVFGPYPKRNFDGRNLRSISATIAGPGGEPLGLMCINLDVSMFETMQAVSRNFLKFADATKPSVLFETDWQDEANTIIGQYLAENRVTLNALSLECREELMALLESRGLFSIRNAPAYIAKVLNISRATLYKSLKAARTSSELNTDDQAIRP